MTHSDLRRRAKVQSMECMVMQHQLCWVGHIIRMSPNRLPRRLLYSELQEGRRSRGGQMKRFSDNIRLLLKKCQIPPGQLEALGPRCHICDRICASDFRLHSHLRIHNVCPQLASTASLSTSTDSYKQRSKCAIVQ